MRALAASAPPDGLIAHPVAQPEGVAQDELLVGEGGVQFGHVHVDPRGRLPSAPSSRPAAAAATGRRRVVRSRAPRAWVSMRWSMPVIQAGRSHSARARSPAARMMAVAPSVMGGRA